MSDTAGTGSLSFDPVAHCYDATRGYPPGVAETIADAMLRYGPLAPGARALEIGIGTGRIALPLLARGVNITGLDISQRMLDRLRANEAAARAADPEAPWGRLEASLGDIAALPFAAGAFDAVVAVHVFHLLTQWRAAFSEALRVLRPGAPLLLGGGCRPRRLRLASHAGRVGRYYARTRRRATPPGRPELQRDSGGSARAWPACGGMAGGRLEGRAYTG